MSQTPAGPGWWQASDGRWYPPQAHPAAPPPAPGPPPALPTMPAPGWQQGPQGQPPTYPPSFPPTVPPGPPARPPGRGRGWLVALVVVLLAGLIGATGAFIYVEYLVDDEPEITGDPVTLEPVDEIGASPFVTGNAVATTGLSSAAVDAANAITADLEVDEATDARVATGTEPGLYGGTMDEQACDPFGLADFLEAEPEKASVWAGVLGIAPEDISAYVENLTPVLLTADTWVTNHGFEDGEATPFQSVLQAGTAVLIDDRGVPRVRCFCGNPLLEPETRDHTLHATEGEAWDDYEPETVRRVQGSEESLETVTLLDAHSGDQFDRGLGPGQTGAVQATLRWSTPADMDLHLIDPNGEEIYFGSTTSSSGGELDLDKIPDCGAAGDKGPHTENIFWDEDAPPGEYTVFVVDYGACDTTTEFSLQVVVGGSTVVSETGALSASAEEGTRFTFEVY